MSHRLPLAALTLALWAGAACAEDIRLYGAGESVDPQDVARILDRSPKPALGKMRSIRLLDDVAPARQAALAPQAADEVPPAPGTAAPAPKPDALALPVQFAFDSIQILPAARPQLDALAAGIRLLPRAQSVVIEGHTDAMGPDHYNEQLSLHRAYAVKRYLVKVHGIDPSRLRAVGMGEFATLPGRDPLAAENRRVQFRGA